MHKGIKIQKLSTCMYVAIQSNLVRKSMFTTSTSLQQHTWQEWIQWSSKDRHPCLRDWHPHLFLGQPSGYKLKPSSSPNLCNGKDIEELTQNPGLLVLLNVLDVQMDACPKGYHELFSRQSTDQGVVVWHCCHAVIR